MEQSGTESWMDAEMQGVRYGPDDPVGVPVVDLPEPGARHDHPAGERQQRVPVGARRDGRRHPPRQVLPQRVHLQRPGPRRGVLSLSAFSLLQEEGRSRQRLGRAAGGAQARGKAAEDNDNNVGGVDDAEQSVASPRTTTPPSPLSPLLLLPCVQREEMETSLTSCWSMWLRHPR